MHIPAPFFHQSPIVVIVEMEPNLLMRAWMMAHVWSTQYQAKEVTGIVVPI